MNQFLIGIPSAYDKRPKVSILTHWIWSLDQPRFHGSSSSRRCIEWPSTILVRTSRSQTYGSTSLSFAVSIKDAKIAQRSAPPSLPVKSEFFRKPLVSAP